MPNHLPLLTHRIRRHDDGGDESALARQWRLLELLSSAYKGLTIKDKLWDYKLLL
jgi:hypothetical protein